MNQNHTYYYIKFSLSEINQLLSILKVYCKLSGHLQCGVTVSLLCSSNCNVAQGETVPSRQHTRYQFL